MLIEYTRIGLGQTASARIRTPQYGVDRHGHTLYGGGEGLPISRDDARALEPFDSPCAAFVIRHTVWATDSFKAPVSA